MKVSNVLGSRSAAAAAAVALVASACSDEPAPRPRLVVSVVVDQLRADMLDQFDEAFTGGLRRILDEGLRFTDGVQDHAFTETAAGHATIGTGVVPARHGVIANQWLEETDGGGFAPMYSVADDAVRILGEADAPGRSPRNLQRPGLADWLLGAHPDAIVLSVSRKDRSAIGLAARSSGQVYWLSESELRFVTSDFYRAEYPAWVDDFNDNTLPELANDGVWSGEASRAYAGLSRPDTADGESAALGGTAFPHNAGDRSRVLNWIQVTPYADVAVARLAERGIAELGMGLDDVPDYLGVSFSATDGVGHAWGPLSREQLDNLLALDRSLGELMDVLDARVGEGRWVMSLSADHGVLTLPEHLAARGEDAGRLDSSELTAALGAIQEILVGDGTEAERRARVEAYVASAWAIADVYWHADYAQPADSFAAMYANSYYPGRWRNRLSSLGIEYRLPPNYLVRQVGTSHGTPHYYDRHVPIIFFGAGVGPGVSSERVRTVDIAPTLASLSGIPWPSDLDGRVIF